MISRIKLAWWREALQKLDIAPPPAEPLLEAAARYLLPYGVTGSGLAALENGWAVLLQEEALEPGELKAYASGRGATLFTLTANLLGRSAEKDHLNAGEMWALVDLARHSGEPDSSAALSAARGNLKPLRWPAKLRPLGMLAAVAARDLGAGRFDPQGSPARMLSMLKHRITGT
jgi:phytoene synthase